MTKQSFYQLNHQLRQYDLLLLQMAQIRLQRIFDHNQKLVKHAKEITENIIFDFVEPTFNKIAHLENLYIVNQKIRLHKNKEHIDLIIKITNKYLLHITAEQLKITNAQIFTSNYSFEAPIISHSTHNHVEIILNNNDIIHCIMFNDKFLNKCFQLNNKIYVIEEFTFNPLLIEELENYLGYKIKAIHYQSSYIK